MRAYEIIHAKREGRSLPPAAIAELVDGFTRGEIPDYQMAAFCMAVFIRGMDEGEVAAFTRAMLESGEVLDLSDVPGAKVDKHSTGGVGDKVSLALAPLAAACGVKVPMISGRGLGHAGGTLDKLEAIPGFVTGQSREAFDRLLETVGVIPLRYKGKLDGILTVGPKGNGEPFVQSDIDLLDALAGHAAVAIENARLYEEAKRAHESLQESEARFSSVVEHSIQKALSQ